MVEKVCSFGNGRRLIGILGESDAGREKDGRPAVLFWNAGLLHRIGPNRLYVDLARKLTSMGFVTFRFDIAGIGDSEIGKDCRSEGLRRLEDVQAAMDLVRETKDINEFVLVGLCSGADDAHKVAAKDTRVSGTVSLDGYAYPTFGFYLRDYGPAVINPTRWYNFVMKRLQKTFTHFIQAERANPSKRLNFVLKAPPKEEVRRDLLQLVSRGVNLLYVYSGGISGFYNYRNQFVDAFRNVDFKGRLQLEYFPGADHTYTRLSEREKLMDCICGWLERHFGGGCS